MCILLCLFQTSLEVHRTCRCSKTTITGLSAVLYPTWDGKGLLASPLVPNKVGVIVDLQKSFPMIGGQPDALGLPAAVVTSGSACNGWSNFLCSAPAFSAFLPTMLLLFLKDQHLASLIFSNAFPLFCLISTPGLLFLCSFFQYWICCSYFPSF